MTPITFLHSFFILVGASSAWAKTQCTDQPKSKWMSETQFRQMAEARGYRIRKFKQPGTCYEIYGTNHQGKKVEVYFNPVTGDPVKTK